MTYRDGDATMKRRTEGRYDPKRNARMPANGLGVPAVTPNVRVIQAIVADPMEPGAESFVHVNRHVDTLENERSHKRISEAAYRVGRDLQLIFEVCARVGSGSQWKEGDRVDLQLAIEHRIHKNIDAARAVDGEMGRLRLEVGALGAVFLRNILTGGSFAEVAGADASRKEIAIVAGRFRAMLEEIVRCREANGGSSSRIRSWSEQA